MLKALSIAAVAVVLSAPAATADGSLTIGATTVTPRSSSAAVGWQASAPARVVAEYGITDEYGVWSKATVALKTSGQVVLAGLEPGSSYRFRLVATAGGQRAEATGSFATLPIPARTNATTRPDALLLDGQPFFPRMVWKQCPWAYGASLAAGINVFMGNGCGSGRDQLAAVAGRAFSVLGVAARGLNGRGLIGWHQPDEPDEHAPKGGLPLLRPSSQTKRVSFLTLGNHFFSGSAPPPQGRGMYPDLVARAEMIGFDLYPLQIWCRRNAFQAVYEAQRELGALAAGKPTYQWIEAGPMHQCRGFDPSRATVRAETWLAIAGGARGIGYFPDSWWPGIAEEIAGINQEIASLAPALLASEAPVSTDQTSPVKVGARSYNGATYVIAVNSSLARVRATFSVLGLLATSVSVFGEARTLPVQAGTISDSFRGLGVHVYVVPPVS